MARIELRNATIRLVDGHSNTSAVNGIVAALATSMIIDTVATAAIIPVTSRFTVAGVTGQFTVLTQDANSEWSLDLDTPTAGTFDLTLNAETAATFLLLSSPDRSRPARLRLARLRSVRLRSVWSSDAKPSFHASPCESQEPFGRCAARRVSQTGHRRLPR